jgi:hypothetical protein
VTQIPGSFDPPTTEGSSATVQRIKEGQRRKAIQSMQTNDKETERLIRRIERAARAAKLQRVSQTECRWRYYELNMPRRQQEVEIER